MRLSSGDHCADVLVPLPDVTVTMVAFDGSSPGFSGEPAFNRKEDVIYGRKYGTALTLDVFTPAKQPNGIGIIFVVSGGFFSSHEAVNPSFMQPLLDHPSPIQPYAPGSWGPKAADALVAGHGHWHEPWIVS